MLSYALNLVLDNDGNIMPLITDGGNTVRKTLPPHNKKSGGARPGAGANPIDGSAKRVFNPAHCAPVESPLDSLSKRLIGNPFACCTTCKGYQKRIVKMKDGSMQERETCRVRCSACNAESKRVRSALKEIVNAHDEIDYSVACGMSNAWLTALIEQTRQDVESLPTSREIFGCKRRNQKSDCKCDICKVSLRYLLKQASSKVSKLRAKIRKFETDGCFAGWSPQELKSLSPCEFKSHVNDFNRMVESLKRNLAMLRKKQGQAKHDYNHAIALHEIHREVSERSLGMLDGIAYYIARKQNRGRLLFNRLQSLQSKDMASGIVNTAAIASGMWLVANGMPLFDNNGMPTPLPIGVVCALSHSILSKESRHMTHESCNVNIMGEDSYEDRFIDGTIVNSRLARRIQPLPFEGISFNTLLECLGRDKMLNLANRARLTRKETLCVFLVAVRGLTFVNASTRMGMKCESNSRNMFYRAVAKIQNCNFYGD